MPMEEWMKCLSPPNISRVSELTFVAAESNTNEVNCDVYFRRNKSTGKTQHTAHVVTSNGSQARNSYLSWTRLFMPCFMPESPLEVATLADVATWWCARGSMNAPCRRYQRTFITSEASVTNFFNCIWFCWNAVYPWNSRSFLWTQTLHPPFIGIVGSW